MPNLPKNATRDDDRVPVIMGVSSQTVTINGVNYVTGVTPVPIAVDPVTGKIILESV